MALFDLPDSVPAIAAGMVWVTPGTSAGVDVAAERILTSGSNLVVSCFSLLHLFGGFAALELNACNSSSSKIFGAGLLCEFGPTVLLDSSPKREVFLRVSSGLPLQILP